VKAFLRGRYNGNLVVPVEAKVLMMGRNKKKLKDNFDTLPTAVYIDSSQVTGFTTSEEIRKD